MVPIPEVRWFKVRIPGSRQERNGPRRRIRGERRAYKLRDEEGFGLPQQAWGKKRERQYEHIKSEQKQQGASEDRAEEIAARTVNNRARSGQSRRASKTSTQDVSPQHRGSKRSGNRQGPGGPTKAQLYNDAKKRNIRGRSKMTKRQLQNAFGR